MICTAVLPRESTRILRSSRKRRTDNAKSERYVGRVAKYIFPDLIEALLQGLIIVRERYEVAICNFRLLQFVTTGGGNKTEGGIISRRWLSPRSSDSSVARINQPALINGRLTTVLSPDTYRAALRGANA